MKRLSAAVTAIALALLAAGLILVVVGSAGASAQSTDQQPPGSASQPQSTTGWTVLVDDYEPQPLPGHSVWYTNRLGGDRGSIDGPGGGTVQWGSGLVTATISGGTSSWQGVWTSLNHPIIDCAPLDFSAILPPAIEPQYQGAVSVLRFHILDGRGDFKVELRIGENTHCPPQIPVPAWPPKSVTLTGGAQTVTFTLPSDVGQVGALNWLVLGGAGDFVVVDRVELLVDLADLDVPAQRAFLHSYAMLLNNWDPATGLTRDRAAWNAGDFDNVSASGMQAAAAAMAWRLGFLSQVSATEIVTKTTEGLLALPTDECGGNLWPHFARDGQLAPDTEWSSIDTAIALLALIEARQALGLDTTEAEAVLTNIAWEDLILPDGHISHGYQEDCQPIEPTGEGGWKDFGTESWLVNLAYAAATGNVADFYHTPPTHNGSGFIDELAWLLVPAPCRDGWGTAWNSWRQQAADAQLAYYQEHACYSGPPRLFGLSAAEVPDLSAVPITQTYQAFGVGGVISPNDGTDLLGHAVLTPHYAGLVAALCPGEAAALWEWLEGEGLFTPLNNVESLMIVDEATCEEVIWNGLKGSWNLSLQTLGWGGLLAGENHPLYAAMGSNDLLSQGYGVMGRLYCPAYLPLVWRGDAGEAVAPGE